MDGMAQQRLYHSLGHMINNQHWKENTPSGQDWKKTTPSEQDWKELIHPDSTEEMLLLNCTEKHNWFGLHCKHYYKIIYVIDYFCLPVVPGCNA